MIKFDIHNKFTGKVQFTAEIDCNESDRPSLKVGSAVEWAIKSNAYLRYADLSDANLSNANLSDANLRYADLSNADLSSAHGINERIKCIQIEQYPITYTDTVMQIGCESHLISEWVDFNDKRILRMDGKTALKFWRKYKEWIFQTIELCPAEPTSDAR